MKLYKCIVDDGHDVFRTYTAAASKKEMLDTYGGNGTFEKIEDVTREYLNETSADKLDADLLRMGWGNGERAILRALLEDHLRKRGL